MRFDEALADIDMLIRVGSSHHSVSQDDITCGDTQKAVRLVAAAYDHLRKRDPLYGDRRRFRSLAPPPGSVPPA
jgi:hypothetical protein